MQLVKIFAPLNGKDFLTTEEACEYLCISETMFRDLKKLTKLKAVPDYPKTVYKREDLYYIVTHWKEFIGD